MTPKKYHVASISAFVLISFSLFIFLAACWSASADAQGPVALFVVGPVLLVLLVSAYFLGRYASNTLSSGWRAQRFSQSMATYFILFYVSAYVPGFGFISKATISFVANTFEKATGKTPYQWEREQALKKAEALKVREK